MEINDTQVTIEVYKFFSSSNIYVAYCKHP